MKLQISEVRKKEIVQRFIAFLLIVALTMANLAFLSEKAITYAADAIATNENNVTFDSYFKDADGNEVASISESINNNDIRLYMQVSVKKDGYFNGTITIRKQQF